MKIEHIISPRLIKEGGMVEPNTLMSIRNVVQRGFANNTFEFVVMTRLLQLLKAGMFYKNSNPLFEPNITTSPELMQLLRAMQPEDIKNLATKLLDLLEIKDADKYYFLVNPAQEYAEWLRWFYHAREATD